MTVNKNIYNGTRASNISDKQEERLENNKKSNKIPTASNINWNKSERQRMEIKLINLRLSEIFDHKSRRLKKQQ